MTEQTDGTVALHGGEQPLNTTMHHDRLLAEMPLDPSRQPVPCRLHAAPQFTSPRNCQLGGRLLEKNTHGRLLL